MFPEAEHHLVVCWGTGKVGQMSCPNPSYVYHPPRTNSPSPLEDPGPKMDPPHGQNVNKGWFFFPPDVP